MPLNLRRNLRVWIEDMAVSGKIGTTGKYIVISDEIDCLRFRPREFREIVEWVQSQLPTEETDG